MSIRLSPRGNAWIEKQLLSEGPGTVPELVAAFIATSKNPIESVEDVQVELTALDPDLVERSFIALSQQGMVRVA